MAEHTPGEWHVSEYGGSVCAETDGKHGLDSRQVAMVSDPDDPMHSTGVDKANAEYIVKCVNNFPDLLEALKEGLHKFESIGLGDKPVSRHMRTAIEKAKGVAV